MYFTPQQLSGGTSFSHSTRIGNWFEDQEATDAKIKNYMAQKEGDKLAVNHTQRKFALAAQRVNNLLSFVFITSFVFRLLILTEKMEA